MQAPYQRFFQGNGNGPQAIPYVRGLLGADPSAHVPTTK